MKKYLKATGLILGLFILYQLALFVGGIVYTLTYGIYKSAITGKVVADALTEENINIPIILLIGEMLLLMAFIPIIKEKLVQRGSFKKINFNSITNIFILAIGMDGIMSLISIVLYPIFPSYLEVSKAISNASDSYLSLIGIVIVAPVFEEIFFRGFIFGYLKKNFNIVGAIIVQALVFGVMHGNMIQGIYSSILGIVFAVVYIHYESLFACITLHIVVNFLGSVVNSLLLSNIDSDIVAIIMSGIIAVFFSAIAGIKIFKEHKSKVNEKISIE